MRFEFGRDKWNSYVVPYVPTFMDGWTPDASFLIDEKEAESKRQSVMSREVIILSLHCVD